MIQEEGIVGVCEHNVFSKKGSFKEGMIAVYLLENIVIPMHKPKLTAAFAWRFIVKIEGVLCHQYVVVS